jgi:lysophospholipase L1-like esterase
VQENEDNIKRNNFNEILREKYKGSGRLFDLARYEAAGMNGANSIFRSNGQTYSALAEEWTSDGGHLNRDARDMVAKELLLFLLKIK